MFDFENELRIFTSGGGLDELPNEDRLAPSRPASRPMSHSDVVSESLKRDVVLGGDKWSVGVRIMSSSFPGSLSSLRNYG